MQPIKYYDIETLMNTFVKSIGGKLGDDIYSTMDSRPQNADYIFFNDNVIAELKIFKKDLFSVDEDIERRNNLFQKWVAEGYFKDGRDVYRAIRHGILPNRCNEELAKLAKRTIERAVHKANKQIAKTKEHLDLHNSKGLVFLANDGNLFLSHYHFLNTIIEVVSDNRNSSNIDAFIYFTINISAYNGEDNHSHHLWYPLFKSDDGEEFHSFMRILCETFLNDFLPKYTNTPVYPIDSTDDILKGIKDIAKLRYYSKEMYSNK